MTAFGALSVAILKGFLRDRAAVFFAVVFPLMFLGLFGGIFGNQDQPRLEVIAVGEVPVLDNLPDEARDAFEISHTSDLDAAVAEVRDGGADVAVTMDGDALVARYSASDPVSAATTQVALQALVNGANLAAVGARPTLVLRAEQVEDESLKAIQYYTPGLLGWAVAMSASFGAAATLQGWRKSKLLRRLQLAPVSTGTVVGARVAVTLLVALAQFAIFVSVAAVVFGLKLTGAWWMALPLLMVGTLCFMAVGLLAGAIATTEEGAVNGANFLVLPMAFLSGSFFPLDAMPDWLQTVSQFLPLRHLNEGMLDVMVRGEGPAAALAPMAVLAAFAIAVTALAARLFRWDTV